MKTLTPVERVDRRATRAAASARESGGVKLVGWLSEIADQPQLISLCTATALWGLVAGNRRLARTGARMLAAELVATGLKTIVKKQVDRTRPSVEMDGGRYRMEPGDTDDSRLNSFPSGHTAGAVAVARAIVHDHPGLAVPATLAAATIAAVQVPRCRHYPSDLAAGALIGLLADALVHTGETLLFPLVEAERVEVVGGPKEEPIAAVGR